MKSEKLRAVVVYTPNHMVEPFRIVASISDFKKAADIATSWNNAPAEDSITRSFCVYPGLTDKQILDFLNGTMEFATDGLMNKIRNISKKGRKKK